jgi:uncharacterized protein
LEHLYLFIFLALLAEILGTVGGFGSSLFFVPIAAFFLDFHSVLGVTAIFHLSSNISKIFLFKKGISWKLVIRLGIPAVVMVAVGAFCSKYFDGKILEIALAIFLITLSGLLIIFRNIVVAPTLSNSIIGGSLSGFIAGLLGTGGAIRGITLAAFNLQKDMFIATSAIIDFGIDFSRSIVYFSNGYVHKHDLYLVPILLVVSIVGTYIGKLILNHVSETMFKNLVLYLVLFVGIATIIKQLI